MIPNGIYVKSSLDRLVSELSGGIPGLERLKDPEGPWPNGACSVPGVVLLLGDRGDGWIHVQMTGNTEAVGIAAGFFTRHRSLEQVLVWDCSDEAMEYNYSMFQKGKLLEQFSVKGPALETVSFVSELRRVQLPELINSRDFAEKAWDKFGLSGENGKRESTERIRFEFSMPPKRSLLKSLLGTLAGGELLSP